MTKLQTLFTSLKKKIVQPKVYAIEMKDDSSTYLYLGLAYSLEEAMQNCRNEIANNVTIPKNRGTWQLGKYAFKDVSKIVDDSTSLETVAVSKDETPDKNTLMKKIIDEKNVSLFHENLSIFSEHEKELLNVELTKKK